MISIKRLIVILMLLASCALAASEPTTGIQLGDTILPAGAFPSHVANKGFGGWHTTTNVPLYLLTDGMAAFTNGIIYVYTNGQWNVFPVGDSTNGLASINYVDLTTQGLVKADITNGILAAANSYTDLATQGLVKADITNGILFSANAYTDQSTQGLVGASITNGILQAANDFTTNAIVNVITNIDGSGFTSITNGGTITVSITDPGSSNALTSLWLMDLEGDLYPNTNTTTIIEMWWRADNERDLIPRAL